MRDVLIVRAFLSFLKIWSIWVNSYERYSQHSALSSSKVNKLLLQHFRATTMTNLNNCIVVLTVMHSHSNDDGRWHVKFVDTPRWCKRSSFHNHLRCNLAFDMQIGHLFITACRRTDDFCANSLAQNSYDAIWMKVLLWRNVI